jgi:type VI secretion system protein VasI
LVRVIVFVLSLLVISAPAGAQDSGESCAAIAADAERLACYDALFRAPDDGGTPVDVPGATDVRILSEQQIPARPTGRAPAEMVIACVNGGISVRFSFANQLLSSTADNVGLTLQADLGGNIVRNLPVDADNTTAAFASARDATVFLGTLEGARSLRVRVTPVRQRSLTVDFRLSDLAGEIEAVRASCAG